MVPEVKNRGKVLEEEVLRTEYSLTETSFNKPDKSFDISFLYKEIPGERIVKFLDLDPEMMTHTRRVHLDEDKGQIAMKFLIKQPGLKKDEKKWVTLEFKND